MKHIFTYLYWRWWAFWNVYCSRCALPKDADRGVLYCSRCDERIIRDVKQDEQFRLSWFKSRMRFPL